jgi:orotidine-5'-phosphate decarboxylase
MIPARDRLIVALDLPNTKAAEAMVAKLGDEVSFYKIGMELTYGGGLGLARDLVQAGKKVFLDLKLHDIPNTVARATAQVADMGATFLTVHAYPQTMRAAYGALDGSSLKLLAVTVMTSYDDSDLKEAGYAYGVKELVTEEVGDMRQLLGPDMLLVTPGIRPADAEIGDQKRVMTPARAIAAGSDHLVVGRPVTQAADPAAAARAIVAEIASVKK